jgi:thiol-disulfide isomerase/thioredoxin
MVFGIIPESCSASARNGVRLQPGIVFGLPRNTHKAGGTMKYALMLALMTVSQASADLVTQVRGAVAEGDLSKATAYVHAYQSTKGATPELVTALSWVARGALGQKNYEQAEAVAKETYELSLELLKKRNLDDEPTLPIGLGAAIEVQAQVLAARGQPTEAVMYLHDELATYRSTSIATRIQKNVHLLSLEGKPAPALQGVALPKGKPVLLFFWAHWCGDCRAEIPILARLKAEFGPKGLVVIGPTQKYGYAAGGEDASPEAELRYIERVRKEYYAGIVGSPAVVSEDNFRNYGVSTTPTVLLIDREGIVRLYHPGRMTYDELQARIQALR